MAICEACHGSGWLFFYDGPGCQQSCPECQGSGIVSCCDTAGAGSLSLKEMAASMRRVAWRELMPLKERLLAKDDVE